MSRRTSRSTIDRFCSLMSMKAMSMAPNSGTVRMSPTSLRVNPMLPAPMNATLNELESDGLRSDDMPASCADTPMA